ncbi:hypothetical protein GHK92_17665 [Nocardioides sp. dk4132]|uniref:hypothetical protein n=1 Tax=unclassified Nocardioides TaxID=2615069 RepID=UPI001294FDF3|nr:MULTISPECIES: hypothetical protein [unclassified Nocardioides]MQW77703.1 hypothetical protein [Nocardioides sp. dk4132]QGA07105.1 hypothetical protein GFH29_06700 [Nocardioides sp. dk884]
MAKALIGHLSRDLRTPSHLMVENSRLRARVGELEALVLRLAEENDRLSAAHRTDLLELDNAASFEDMQPA